MNPLIISNFNGDVVEELMTLAVTQNEIVDSGAIYVDDNIQLKRSLVKVRQSNIIQKPAATPTSYGQLTTTEAVLQPDDFLVYIEFDPNEFRKIWSKWAPTGDFVFTQLAPEVQSELLRMLLEGEYGVNTYMGNAILNGDKALVDTNELSRFDGIVTKAIANNDVIDVAGAAALDATNIVAKMQAVYDASRKPTRENKDFKYFLSKTDREKYRTYLQNLANKSIDPTQDAPALFHGKEIVYLSDLAENTMFGTIANDTKTSNIWLGVKGIADFSQIKVDIVQNNSDLWFFKMKMSADTQIKFGEDFTLYKP